MGTAKRPSKVVAEQVRRWRGKRSLTVEQLADRVRTLGGDLERVNLTKLENERRGLSLDEGLLLAAALDVPPAVLFFGLGEERRVAVTPKVVLHPHLAAEWLAGAGPLGRLETLADAEWREGAAPLRLHQRLRKAQEAAHRAQKDVRDAEFVGEEAAIHKARRRFGGALRDLANILVEMRAAGITPPKMPREWTDAMQSLGIEEGV